MEISEMNAQLMGHKLLREFHPERSEGSHYSTPQNDRYKKGA